MEGIKEKGFFRRFLDWLNKIDENDVDDRGDINENAFKGVDAKIMKALKDTSRNVDRMIQENKKRIVKHITPAPLKEETQQTTKQSIETENTIQQEEYEPE